MDIGGVATPVVNDPSKQRTGDTVSASIVGKAPAADAETAAHVAKNVVDESSNIPSEKLPPHLGRNLNVTA